MQRETRMRMVLASLLLALLLAPSAARSQVRITNDMGGAMTEYADRWAHVRQSGERVITEGKCYSACTMLLGLLAPGQACVTPNASLGLHTAWHFDETGHQVASPLATQALLDIYPERVRGWIARHGGLTPTIKILSGRELAEILPRCEKSAATKLAQPSSRKTLNAIAYYKR